MITSPIRPLLSGGAILSLNGVDRWCPSRRDALDELEACKPRGTIDYPLAPTPGVHQNADVNA